uniref:adenosine kinase n=1 Tax=Timema tahoe TaxID=61484 RepID=A0A7R9IQ42_9NEOP|nr:unnamed protein product [Timema tahoe]
MEKLRENKFIPVLAAFGNPLLDIYAKMNSTDILEKYGLDMDGAREIPNNELSRALFQEVCDGHEVYLNAGGSAQNTARIFQWLVGHQHGCVYFGSIGCDEEGTLVETLLRRSGVHTRYTSHRNLPTGRCLALVHGEHRSLVANIGAARIYAPHHLNTQDNLKVLSQVKIIYIEGFFIANNFLTAKELIHFCQAKSIILAFNLSSPYICKENPSQVEELVKSADIIFGNEDEYKTLSDTLELGLTGLRDIVEVIKDLNHLHPHIMVIFPPFLLGERGLVEDAATACWRLAHASASLGTYDILTPPYALRGVSTTTRHVAFGCRLARASRPIPSTFIVTIATIPVVPRATRVASTAGESPLTLGTARCYFLNFHYTLLFLHFLTLEPYTKLSLPLPLPAGGGGRLREWGCRQLGHGRCMAASYVSAVGRLPGVEAEVEVCEVQGLPASVPRVEESL